MTTAAAASAALQPSTRSATRSSVLYASHTARVLLGLLFTVTGADGFLHFIPPPSAPIPAGALALATAMVSSGYLFALVKGTELVAGVLLLSNRFVPLALAVLAPVVVNIVAFHAFLDPSGVAIALVLAAAQAFLAWSYREAFRPMLRARVDVRGPHGRGAHPC